VIQAPQVMITGVPANLLRNRPDIRQAEYELQASRADVAAARAAFFPSLQIAGNVGLQSYKAASLLLFPESIAYGLFAGLSAPLLNRSQIKGDFAVAAAGHREAFLQYGKLVNRAFQEVQLELDRMEHLENMHRYREQQSTILQSSTTISGDLFRTGRAAYLEVLLARQNALRANMELITTRKDQYLAAVNLYRALGGGN
jgi:outer membrane protein TolC